MKSILVVSTSLKTQGGISRVVYSILNSRLNDKYKLYHLATHINKSIGVKFLYMLVSYIKYPFILVNKKIVIVHIHGGMKSTFFRKSYFLIIGKLFRRKVIYHMHSAMIEEYFDKRSYLKGWVVCKLLDHYDAIIAISNVWKKILEKKTSTNIFVIYNAIKLPQDIPNNVKKKQETFTVLTMGEVGERKGTGVVIKVAATLNNNFRFVIAGNGDVGKYLKMAEDFGISNRVVFLGWINGEKKDKAYLEADVYFLPSKYEGLPMSIIEAMGYGLPIISTSIGGIPDCVENGKNGFLERPEYVDNFASRIRTVCENSKLYAEMSKASRLLAEERFEVSVMAAKINDLYNELLGKEE